jgi:serine/tyrosine/threonine adenylyltransferase
VDFTLGFRRLADALRGETAPLEHLFGDGRAALSAWLQDWRRHLPDTPDARHATAQAMDAVNPIHIPRNHRVEEALDAATEALDLAPFEALLDAVTHPFEEHPGRAHAAQPAPPGAMAGYRTFCGT